MIVDAWIQHPTLRLAADPMFEPLRRWNRRSVPTADLPLPATLAALRQGGVTRALTSARTVHAGAPISNDFNAQARALLQTGNATRVYRLDPA